MGIIFLIVYLFLFFAFFFTLSTPYMRAVCKYILLQDFQFSFGGVTLTYDFNEIGAYFGQCYSGDSFNQHYYPAVALALDFHKISFGAIKCTAMDTHSCAFADVYLPVAFGFSVASGFFTTVGEFTGALSPEFCSAHSCEPFGACPPPLGGLPPKISSNVAIGELI